MAKEKSGASAVVLRTTLTQGAANGFIQSTLLTGLSSGGNDALLVKEIALEFVGVAPAAAAITEMEAALTRATKAAMPTLADDDVLFKHRHSAYYAASLYPEPGIVRYNPVEPLVIIEDAIYAAFKSINLAAATSVIVLITAVPATVTESEKVGILLTRLN